MTQSTKKILRERVNERRGLLVPGAFNALSARTIADLGFEAVYPSGAGMTNMFHGLPLLAFPGLPHLTDSTAPLRDPDRVSGYSSPKPKSINSKRAASSSNQMLPTNTNGNSATM